MKPKEIEKPMERDPVAEAIYSFNFVLRDQKWDEKWLDRLEVLAHEIKRLRQEVEKMRAVVEAARFIEPAVTAGRSPGSWVTLRDTLADLDALSRVEGREKK